MPETLTVQEMNERIRPADVPERLTLDDMAVHAKAMTLAERVRQEFGMDPDIEDRNMLYPNPNRSWNPAEWTAPAWLYGVAKAVALGQHIKAGGSWTPEEITEMALTIAGGGAPTAGGKVAREALEHGLRSRRASAVGIYDAPARPNRPFAADYPRGARTDGAGNLTHDIEGRPLDGGGRIVGRQTAGGADEPLPYAEYDAVVREATGRNTEMVPLSFFGKESEAVGATLSNEVTKEPWGVFLWTGLTRQDLPRVYGHEIGHVIDQLAGEIPTAGLEDEMRAVYNTLGNQVRDGAEAAKNALPRTPEGDRYKPADVPRELIAEAIRAYLTNPNYLKTEAPLTAAAIRQAANSHPKVRKIVQFNANGLPFPVTLEGTGNASGAEPEQRTVPPEFMGNPQKWFDMMKGA